MAPNPAAAPALVVLWALLGWLIGGPMGALAVSLPAGHVRTSLTGRCGKCGATFSRAAVLLRLRRRAEICQECGEALREPWPYPEAAMALVFALVAWRFGWGPWLAVYSVFCATLVLVVFVDLRHRLILDAVTYPAILAAVACAIVAGGAVPALLGGAVVGATFLAFYLLARVLYRSAGALGLGDVKLAVLVGLLVGWPSALTAIMVSVVAGAVAAVALLVAGRSRNSTMPYGPNLVLGAIAALLLGPGPWK